MARGELAAWSANSGEVQQGGGWEKRRFHPYQGEIGTTVGWRR